MAKSYKASQEVSVWKQHICVACGSKYRYHLERTATAQAGTEAGARDEAAKLAEKMIRTNVDVLPCPGCGCIQPDMVQNVRTPYYIAGAGISVLGTLVALCGGMAHGFTINTSSIIAVTSLAVGLFLSLIGSARNPNGSLAGNLAKAQEKVDARKLFHDERTSGAPEDPSMLMASPFSGRGLLALVLLAAVVVVGAMPIVMSTVNGWPLNDDWYPAVVGPGDESTLYLNQTLRSVKGYWNGGATTRVTNGGDLGKANMGLTGTTKNSTWGTVISGKSVSSQTSRLWVKYEMPPDASLAGKTLELDVSVSANFPEEMQGGFQDAHQSFQDRSRVTLAPPGAGTTYRRAFWIGEVSAILTAALGCWMLGSAAAAVAKVAHPTKVIPYEEDGPVFDADEPVFDGE